MTEINGTPIFKPMLLQLFHRKICVTAEQRVNPSALLTFLSYLCPDISTAKKISRFPRWRHYMATLPHYRPFMTGIQRSPVNYRHEFYRCWRFETLWHSCDDTAMHRPYLFDTIHFDTSPCSGVPRASGVLYMQTLSSPLAAAKPIGRQTATEWWSQNSSGHYSIKMMARDLNFHVTQVIWLSFVNYWKVLRFEC